MGVQLSWLEHTAVLVQCKEHGNQLEEKLTKSQIVSNFRRRRKQKLVQICGGQCNLCGYKKCISALEFHHIDEEKKSYALSKKGTTHNLEKDIAEIQKCILVCANCHREIHDGFYTEEELKNKAIFKEELAESFLHPPKKEKPKIERKVKESKIPSREILKDLIRNKSFLSIGVQFDVSDNSIRNWCKKYNLPFKKTEINKFSDSDWLQV